MPNYDLGIAVQFAELVNRIRKDQVNDIWARQMLQRIIEDDHLGDQDLLCRAFLHLLRPPLKEIAEFLENPSANDKWAKSHDHLILGSRTSVDEDTLKALSTFNFMEEPLGITLVKLNASSFFEPHLTGWSEKKIRDMAHEMYGLVPCPMWVLPAMAIKSKKGEGSNIDFTQMKVCVSEDLQKISAFSVIYGKHWWIRTRSGDLNTTWESGTWLMAMP